MNEKEEMREDLVQRIEKARQILNNSIDERKQYELIYENSVRLDSLIEQYIVAGF